MNDSTVAIVLSIGVARWQSDASDAWRIKRESWLRNNAVVFTEMPGPTLVSLLYEGMELELGDCIRTGPECVVVLQFVIGGEVIVARSSAVEITGERRVADVEFRWMRMEGRIRRLLDIRAQTKGLSEEGRYGHMNMEPNRYRSLKG